MGIPIMVKRHIYIHTVTGTQHPSCQDICKRCDLRVQLLLTTQQDLFLRNVGHGSLIQIENLHHDMTNKSRLLNL